MRHIKINKKKLKLSDALTYFILTICSLYTIFPLAILVINSFKGHGEIASSPLALPKSLDFQYIINAFKAINFIEAFFVTLTITVCSVGIIILTSSIAAWMLVRNKTKISNTIFLIFVASMIIPFQAIMYPLVSFMDMLMLKNFVGLVFMYGGFGLSMSIFLYHGFIKSVPKEIEEAAIIDGASIFQIFFLVVFPLLKPITITITILNSMWIWNDYLLPFLVIGNSNVQTLTLKVYFARILSGQYGNPWEVIFPAVLVSVIPIVIIFIFLQKYIVKGISDGAVKS